MTYRISLRTESRYVLSVLENYETTLFRGEEPVVFPPDRTSSRSPTSGSVPDLRGSRKDIGHI